MEIRSLGSGSSGNSFVVTTDRHAMFIDAGFSKRRMIAEYRGVRDRGLIVTAIVLTHEHVDHARGALALARVSGAPLVGTAGTIEALGEALDDPAIVRSVVRRDETIDIAPFHLEMRPVPHDAADPVAIRIDADAARAVVALDLGNTTRDDRDWMADADLLVVESNHDVTRLMNGPYPEHLKRRIVGQRGHLSNDQAADCIAHVLAHGRTSTVWLAHLSAINNTRTAALQRAQDAIGSHRVAVSACARDRPSLAWSSRASYRQATLW